MRLSDRVLGLKTSSTIAMMNRAKRLQAEGVDVLSFSAGEPDFDTPQVIKQAAIDALNKGQTKYTQTFGDVETRRAIADKLMRENGIPGVTPEHVCISAGGKHSLYVLFHCLLDPPPPGIAPLEVILPTPAWVSYAPHVELAGGKVIEVPTTIESGFRMSPEQLRRAITARTRLIILNSPCNPCGTMYSPDDLRALAKVIAEAARTSPDLVVISDEIYEKIVYAGIPHFSIGSIPEIAERTTTVNGLSKAFAMTGWRVGYCAGSGDFGLKLARAMATMQGQMTTNITSFIFPAIRAALTMCADDVERMRAAFGRRAELIYRLFAEVSNREAGIAPFPCARPTGAFYLFPDVSSCFGRVTPSGKTIADAGSLCDAMLEEARLAFVPGDDFGGCGPRCVRISFACSEPQIERGIARFAEFVGGLR